MQSRQRTTRHGFTLVELMVVIGIIALLIAVTAMAIRGFSGSANEKATEATITKIAGLLNDRMQAFHRRAPAPEYVTRAMNEGFATRNDAMIYARKLQFQDEFPQSFAEAAKLLAQAKKQPPPSANNPNPAPYQAAIQNSQLLYFLLVNSSVIGYSPDAGEPFTNQQIRIPEDEPDWPYFVDAWGNPIRFYRWPTRLVRPLGGTNPITAADRERAALLLGELPAWDTATNSDPLNIDPDDPTSVATAAVVSNGLHTPDTYHMPLVVSAGPDGDLGLYEPIESVSNTADDGGRLGRPIANPDGTTAPHPALFDNVTNHNRRAGGQ